MLPIAAALWAAFRSGLHHRPWRIPPRQDKDGHGSVADRPCRDRRRHQLSRNAWEYHEGESERRMGRAIRDRRDRVFLMTKVCTHGRDAKVAMRQLDESLRRLRPTTSTSGRFTSACTTTTRSVTSRRAGSSRPSSRQRRRARFATSGSPVIRTLYPPPHARLGLSVRRVPVAAERLRCRIPQLPDSGAAGIGARRDCRHRDEESGRGWSSHPQESLQWMMPCAMR